MDKGKILVVDDEESIRWVFKKGLEKEGYEVHCAEKARDAIQMVQKTSYAVIFLDVFLPDINGLEALTAFLRIDPELLIIVITAQASMQNTIEAMRRGAYDYLIKPFDFEQVYLQVEKALRSKALKRRVKFLEAEFQNQLMVGSSAKMQEVYKTIGRIADKDVNVLIQGETGTGKELVAKALHFYSKRVDYPFVTANCAAIPKELLESELFGHEKGAFTGALATKIGKFEEADKGTILLDEIGDMDLAIQAKILRVIQEKSFRRLGSKEDRQVDVRILAATNQKLEDLIAQGRFREDLFYRLNVVPIYIPPLREHREDIPELVNYFLKRFQKELGVNVQYISPESLDYLIQYSWPGNIRELENALKRTVVLAQGDTILPEHLPSNIVSNATSNILLGREQEYSLEDLLEAKLDQVVAAFHHLEQRNLYSLVMQAVEKTLFQLTLKETKGNQLKAAAILGINRNTLRKKLKDLGIKINKRELA
jgi:two-component system nitrogen regulation response regulator GlnG